MLPAPTILPAPCRACVAVLNNAHKWKGCDAHVRKHTYGHDGITVHHWGEPARLHIGAFCSIARDVHVFLGGNHRVDWLTTFPFGHISQGVFNAFDGRGHPATKGDVVIGNDVWVGLGATIMSGVTIGDGAVVAARSHVVKDVAPYTIVGGNPARAIRARFDDEAIETLCGMRWWTWPDDVIRRASPILCSGDLAALVRFQEEHHASTVPSCATTTSSPQ